MVRKVIDWCAKHKRKIEKVWFDGCGDWKYWNPHHPPDPSSPFKDDKVCNGCVHRTLRRMDAKE